MILRIPRRSCLCTPCQKPFAEGATYFSKLLFKNEEPLREDFCEACWVEESRESASFWRGVVAAKIEGGQELKLLQQEIHAKALLRLQEATVSASEKYLLALYLKREKRLQLDKEVGRELYFTDRKTKNSFIIEKKALSASDVSMRQALYNLFRHEAVPA